MASVIGISEVAGYVPAQSESNLEKLDRFALDEGFLRDKIGVLRVSRRAPGEETSDMCVRAFEALRARCGIDAGAIDCVIVCTQNPDGRGIPHTSAVVHRKIGAPETAACFDVSLGCSGFVYGLAIAKSFMEANGFTNGLLFTADPYSKILDPDDRNTVLLFGDAAAVTLLQPLPSAGSGWRPTHFRFGTRGAEGAALSNAEGRLAMNGRAVFSFSATAVPAQVRSLLATAGLDAADIDLYLFHQGSKYIVDTLIQRLSLPREKVLLGLSECGNTVSSTIPLLLADERSRAPGVRRVLASGFGVGLSWASCILERI